MRHRAPTHRSGHQPQSTDRWHPAAQMRRIFHPSIHQRQYAVFDRAQRIRSTTGGRWLFAGIFYRRGRSRTGRLLQPKGGMIMMTLQAFLRQPRRPVLFQPIYIGYEKLIEGTSYLDELSGEPKRKNRFGGYFGIFPKCSNRSMARLW